MATASTTNRFALSEKPWWCRVMRAKGGFVRKLRTESIVTIIVLVGAATLAGCAHKKSVVAPEVTPVTETSTPATGPGAGTTLVQPEPAISTADRPEGGVAASDLPTNLEALNRGGYVKDAFFETDKSDLRPETREVLAADASWLSSNPSIKIQIEGHCDERNTEEYNLALGWRRANAAKDYLVSLGVGAERIGTISYGEERPFAQGHEESAWSQNRRVHIVITAR
jgi:peptidoglycan-associated lipoprotein